MVIEILNAPMNNEYDASNLGARRISLLIFVWDSFSRISPLGRWIAEEGHGDPSKRAFEIYCDYRIHI
jgi:hypothetical protein